MNLEIENKVALVTGSTAGIGLAIATVLACEGSSVIVNGRTKERVDAAVATVKSAHAKADVRGIVADLGTREGADKLIGELGRVEILVNNMGQYEVKAFADLADEDWLRLFEVNVMSGVRLSRAYFPKMLEENRGRVIFISSESGVQIPAEMIQYGMTKAAQVAIARGMAEMTAGTQVTVNSVLAGPTRSEGVAGFIQSMAATNKTTIDAVEKDFFKTARPTSLIQRFLTTEEIANTVAYLASPKAAGINGAAIRTEGGLLKGAF